MVKDPVPENLSPMVPSDQVLQDTPNSTGQDRITLSDVNNGATTMDESRIDSEPTGQNLTGDNELSNLIGRQTINEKLLVLRGANPFVPIVQMPNNVLSALLTQNVALDFPIPSQAKYMRFKGKGDYYVSVNGAAAVPTVAGSIAGAPGGAQMGAGVMYKPEETFFYCEEMQSISIVTADVGVIVTAYFYNQA